MFNILIIYIIINYVYCVNINRKLDKNSEEILELHRKYRQDLVDCKVDGQPPAKYMSPLKWNYDLAAQAQKLANQCMFQQEIPYSDEFLCVGQNIVVCPTIKSGVDAWFNEHKLYDYNQNNCMECLHYTQMVWAKTTDIGCGVASCPKYGLSIVCNYGPGGNWTDEKPYEVKSRELCPEKQNIPKDSFQTMRENTQRAPLSIANVNHKLSSTGSSGSRVHERRPNSQCVPTNIIQNNLFNTKSIYGKKALHMLLKSVRSGSGLGYVQGQHNNRRLVWQNTTHVGCGITNCTGNYGFPYGLSVVCNYGPGGNYEGRYPYEAKSQDECYAVTTRRPKTTRRPITTKRPKTTRRPGTIPTRKPDISKQIPKPNWPTLISSWSGFANSNMLHGIVTKTCICIQ
uniref:Venom allergen 5 n=1 Tax=Schistosoma haematobium TaxID=6185 RepID=A0A094ZEH4_SCHHA